MNIFKFQVKTIYEELFPSLANTNLSQGANVSNVSFNSSQPKARLPKIKLPKFSGDFKMFATFIDLYNALVHNDQALTDIENINYLVAFLEGPPLAVVRTLAMTHNNYQLAYNSFVEIYSNKRLSAQSHRKGKGR